MKIWEHSKGKWPQIIAAHLGDEYIDKKHHACPNGDGTDRFRFTDLDGQGRYFCACSQGEAGGIDLLQCTQGVDFKGACELIEAVIGPCTKDGEESKPAPESWASKLRKEVVKTNRSAYLKSRGLEVPAVLDWHKSLAYFDGDGKKAGEYPAMLAPVMRDGKFITYHATYLDGGKKAAVSACRKILPGSGTRGAGVPLYEPEGGLLGVAEGIETAVAAKMLYGTPVHAALNTSLLKNWQPPAGVNEVIVYADNDKNYAGQAAAYALAHRLIGQGYRATVAMPGMPNTDYNDLLLGKVAA